MPDSSDSALLIFIKNPEKGHVKTRLAETVGDQKALEVYQKLLGYTRKVTLQVEADMQLWYSQSVIKKDGWQEEVFTKKQQQGASLGERMKQAFRQAFDEDYEKVVIIGSDCAMLEPRHLKNAYLGLKYHDVVIGPSQDGGYYLLGMSKFLPDVFDDVDWSTERVFDQTVKNCKEEDYLYHVMEQLNDVDTEEDWQQVKGQF